MVTIKKDRGFTLIELMLVALLVSILGLLAARILISIFNANNSSSSSAAIQTSAEQVLSIFENNARSSKGVDLFSDSEIRFSRTDGSIWSLRKVDQVCTDNNSNSYVSYSEFNGFSFPNSPLTPTNVLSGVNVTNLIFTEEEGYIKMDLTLAQACGLPNREDFVSTATFSTKVRPRSLYAN